jgi:hypothetical protein
MDRYQRGLNAVLRLWKELPKGAAGAVWFVVILAIVALVLITSGCSVQLSKDPVTQMDGYAVQFGVSTDDINRWLTVDRGPTEDEAEYTYERWGR